MKRNLAQCLALAAAALLALSACANIDQIGAANAPLKGLSDFSGHGAEPLRVFLIHGMTTHEVGWSHQYLSPVATKLNRKRVHSP